MAEDAFRKPFASFRAGEIDHAAVELAEIDVVWFVAVAPQRQMAAVARLEILRAVDRQIGVGIGEKADTPGFELCDPARQVGIARRIVGEAGGVPGPVPEQATPEAGLADARPVLAPHG